MKTRIVLFLLGIGLLNSCNNDDDNLTVQSTQINFTEIGKGALYGNGQEGISQSNLTISSMNDWQNLISQMNAVNNVSNGFSETDINFNEFMVFAVFLEVKPNGWEVEIENVTENDNSIIVSTTETEFVTLVVTQPFYIIKMPISSKPIIVE